MLIGTSLETLDDIFLPIDRKVSLYSATFSKNHVKKKNFFGKNLEAIRSVGANVRAMWSKEEISNTGWKSGKDMSFSILLYLSCINLQYISYIYIVKQELLQA
jgi:hypothetical protein